MCSNEQELFYQKMTREAITPQDLYILSIDIPSTAKRVKRWSPETF